MKVLIVNSPLFRSKNSLFDEDSLPPIGLGYIATSLKKDGHLISLIDAIDESIPLKDLVDTVNTKNPDVLAVNIFTTNYEIVQDFICAIKNSRIHIIIGGLATKTLYKDIVNWNTENKIDIVFGDGENIIKDLVNQNPKERPIFTKANKNVYKIDKNSSYFIRDISEVELERSFFKIEPILNLYGHKEANIVTSRGCIFNCAFCAAARSLNKDYEIRERSSDSIIAELYHLQNIYPGLKSIRVLDDLFLKNQHSIDKTIYIFNNYNFKWRSMAHVQTFNEVNFNMLEKLKQSGCSELFIGIESGSPKILKKIHKTRNIQLIKENLIKLFKIGISVKGYFVYGFPDETEKDFEMTYELANFLKHQSLKYGTSFRTSVFQFRPYHGTELYRFIEKNKGSIINVNPVEPNEELSSLVGRIQFNFHSGNYSDADIDTVYKYIYKTINLNSSELFNKKN